LPVEPKLSPIIEHRISTTRRARYFTAGGGQKLDEAWIVLHGLGQLASVFISYFKTIATPTRLIVAPEALSRHYVMSGDSGRTKDAKVGATWMTREDRDNEIADYVEYLDAIWRATAATASRVTVLGFSQGVATAARWIALGNGRADRFIAWAGQIPPEVDPAAFKGLSGGLSMVVGSTDEYAPWIAEGDHDARFVKAGVTPQHLTFDGGHRMDRVTLETLADA
jgi:predicted esterase